MNTPYDKYSWSGTNYYVRKALEDLGSSLYSIYGYRKITPRLLFYKLTAKVVGKNFQAVRSKSSSEGWAKYITNCLEPKTDAILSLSTIPIAYLKTKIPIFVYVDGIYEYMLTQGFEKMMNDFDEAHSIEAAALNRSKIIFTSSEASAHTIREQYGISDNKINVIPLGANIDEIPSLSSVMKNIQTKDMQVCKLLFVGVDWKRKGTDIVIKTTKLLYESGFPVELHLVGLRKIPMTLPSYVFNHGFINKMELEGQNRLANLYKNSHFLFVPSIGEAFGLVFCEASAYGLPSISHNIGGIPTIVHNGENGQLFNMGTQPSDFANYIRQTFADKVLYRKLAINSYNRFMNELNWEVSGNKILNQIKAYIG